VNVLDENIPLDQRDLLRTWGVHCRVIGQDIAPISIGDDNILALLHRLKQPTLFTRDEDFFKHRLCHPALKPIAWFVSVHIRSWPWRGSEGGGGVMYWCRRALALLDVPNSPIKQYP
jgi:hypothetical protein